MAESVPLQKFDASSLGSRAGMVIRSKKAHIGKNGVAHYGEPLTDTGNKRNRPCRCGSGKKYKKCCLLPDQGFTKSPEGGYQRGMKFTPEPGMSFDLGSTIGGEHDTV